MKYKFIVRFFIIDLVVLLALRAFQFTLTDFDTGFFKDESKVVALVITAVIALLIIALAVIAFTVRRHPENPPQCNKIIAGSALFLAATVAYEVFTVSLPAVVPSWIALLFKIFGLISCCVLVWYSVTGFNPQIPFAPLSTVFIVLYAFFRLVVTFSSYSSLSNNSFSVVDILALCAVLVWTLYFAKILCGIKGEQSCRRMLPISFIACCLAAINTLPLLVVFFTDFSLHHHITTNTVTTFAMGLFIVTFDVFLFKKENLPGPAAHTSEVLPPDTAVVTNDEFYI